MLCHMDMEWEEATAMDGEEGSDLGSGGIRLPGLMWGWVGEGCRDTHTFLGAHLHPQDIISSQLTIRMRLRQDMHHMPRQLKMRS